MDRLRQIDQQTVNLIAIGAETLALVVLFLVLGWVLGRLLGLLAGVQGLEGSVRVVRRNLRVLLSVLCFLACLAAGGANAWLMVQGEDVLAYQRELLAEVPREVWIGLALGLGKGLALLLGVTFALRHVRRLLAFCCKRAQAFDGIKANDESIAQFFTSLTLMLVRASWIAAWAVIAGWVGLPEGAQAALWTLLRILLIVSGGLLVARALDAVVASLDAWSRRYARPGSWLAHYEKLAHLVPTLRRALEFALYVLVATLVVLQVEAVADLADWGERLINVIGILFLARVVVEVVHLLVKELLLERPELTSVQRRRRTTVVPLVANGAKYLVYFGAGVMVLEELGGDLTAVLAGAGIFSLAVGLAAQDLIGDIVSGLFIMFEDDYLVGDYVEIGAARGVVESIDLRTTCVRDSEGRLHMLRNGQINGVVSYSKDYVNAVVEVGVAYESDLRAVFAAFEEAGSRLAAETGETLAPLELRGLKAFGESELTIRAQVRAQPGKHQAVEFALRKLVWEVFLERGIEIPYARRVVIFKPADEGPAEGSALSSLPVA